VLAENITKEGFNIVFETWSDTKIYAASATWIAFG
jgi:hypothetical protein